MRVNGFRLMQYPSTLSRNLAIWNYVLTNEVATGTEFLMTRTYSPKSTWAVILDLRVYLGMTNEIVPLPKRGRGSYIGAYLSHVYGIMLIEPVGRFIYVTLRNYTISHGVPSLNTDSDVGPVC